MLSAAAGGSGPAGPSNASARDFRNEFDASGWNVNFGSGSIDSARTSDENASNGGAGINMTAVALGAVALVAVAIWARKRKG